MWRFKSSPGQSYIILFLLLLSSCALFAEEVDTFYGKFEVGEPVLIELLHSPPLQRLKSIHQYGVAYYTTEFNEEFNRYDHSLGVFALLRQNNASLEEQIAGLLHDVSHTAFSHVGDWVYGKAHQENDYQNTTHNSYLIASGIAAILNKHGFTTEQVDPKNPKFAMLEHQSLPDLNGDRIDYNIQGAYFQHFLTKEEAIDAFHDARFIDGKWYFTKKDLAQKLMRFSLFMTEYCWTSALNHVTSQWLAEAIIHGVETGIITWRDFHYGTDDLIWNALSTSGNSYIAERMERLSHPLNYFLPADHASADVIIKFRCRGIDPLVSLGKVEARITEMDPELAAALTSLKEKAKLGWAIQLNPASSELLHQRSTFQKAPGAESP